MRRIKHVNVMKKLLLALLVSFIVLNVSAQTKTAYCDVYARGGGLNLNITISFDGNSFDYSQRMNIGEILNIMASDGWVLDREIVIPRHPVFSTFTRHKLHIIMKKEYQEGENPFGLFESQEVSLPSISQERVVEESNDVTPSLTETVGIGNEVIYNDVSAIVIAVEDDKVVLASIDGGEDTWDEAVQYCNSLGAEWRLPSSEELKKYKSKFVVNDYWTCEQVNDNRARYFSYSYLAAYTVNKSRSFYIQPIAVVNISDIEKQ